MDEIVNIVLSVKNMPGGLNEICTFLEGNSGAKKAEGIILRMRGLRPLHRELCDYCFINDSEMDSSLVLEVMVWLHPNFIIHRDDMVSVGSNSEIFCCFIDCWALMLNQNERRKKGGPVKFFFNVSQSVKFLELAFKEENTFIPIFSSNHYFLFVVNIPQKKIQFIDNLSYDKQEKGALSQLCECLDDQVSTFFDGMGLVNAPYIIKYPVEFVLSNRNDVRSKILDKMKAMRPSRPQLQKEVEQRRR
ncbi:ATP-dependent protease ATPase subunit HslU [Bienertia sinuspersici]